MSQSSSDYQGEPLDGGQRMNSSLYEELLSDTDTSPPSMNSLLRHIDSTKIDAEAFMPHLPPPVIPINDSWPGVGVSVPSDPIGPLSLERQPVDPTAPVDHLACFQNEPLYEEPAPDTAFLGYPLSDSDPRNFDIMASESLQVVDQLIHATNSHWFRDCCFSGAPNLAGLPVRRATDPMTPMDHASLHGTLTHQSPSNTRRASLPPLSRSAHADAFHGGCPQVFSSQNRTGHMPLSINPALLSQGGPPPEDADMSRGPTVSFSPSYPSFYGPSISAPTVNSAPISESSATSIPAPPKKMPSTQKHSIQRKRTSQAHKRGSTTQSHGGKLIEGKARAQLVKNSIVSYGDGCRLDNVAALPAEFNTVAFEGQTFTQKASVRFEISPHRPFNCQFNVLHGGGRQPTKRRLAEVAARAVDRFIVDCAKFGWPCGYKLEHFVLRSIVVDSRSGLRLVFDLPIPATI